MRKAHLCLWLGLALLATLRGIPAYAEGQRRAPRPRDVATQVRALFEAKNVEALRDLARREAPDPWHVADVLSSEGAFEAALAFAEAAPRPDVESLPSYVHGRRFAAQDAARLRVIEAARIRLSDRRMDPPPAALTDQYLRARLILRGVGPALRAGRLDDAKQRALMAASAAETVGWLRGASEGARLAGIADLRRGAFRGAMESWLREHALYERRGWAESAANSLLNLGNLQTEIGAYLPALEYFERARLKAASLPPGERRDRIVAQVRETEGLVLSELTRFSEALHSLQQALDVHERLGDRAAIAFASSHLGSLHMRVGDFEASAEAFDRALRTFEDLGQPDDAASVRANLGNLAVEEERFEDAIELLNEALSYYEAREDVRNAASARLGLSVTYRLMDRASEALKLLRGVPEAYAAIGDVSGHAFALVSKGEALLALGRRTEAYVPFDQALSIAEEAHLPYAAFLARVSLARLFAASGRHTEAIGAAREAVASVGDHVGSLSHERSARARGERREAFELGAQSARASDDLVSLVHFLESGRAGALLEEMDARDALAKAVLPAPLLAERRKRRSEEAAAWASYRSVLSGAKRKEIRQAKQGYLDAREALRRTIERIQGEAKAAAPVLYPEAAPLASLCVEVGEGRVLVLYARVEDALVAVVIRAKSASLVELGPYAEAELQCRNAAFDDDTLDPAPVIAELESRLVAPLGLTEADETILIAPIAFLGRVPFSLLVGERGVAFVPSGTTWRRLRNDRQAMGEGVLALGDPDYGTRAGRSARAARGTRGPDARALVPLPGTRAEVEAIGDVVLVGAKATEAGFRKALGTSDRWRAVHLACHGLVDDRRPTLSALALTATEEDDGLLTALQVFETRVPSDLVVLSACETGNVGASGEFAGEGLVGLTRAFLTAGAPRVLVSAWPVDDEATAVLMQHFYESWKTGRTSAAASLRRAQARVRAEKRWRHPRYWAAWLLWGLAD